MDQQEIISFNICHVENARFNFHRDIYTIDFCVGLWNRRDRGGGGGEAGLSANTRREHDRSKYIQGRAIHSYDIMEYCRERTCTHVETRHDFARTRSSSLSPRNTWSRAEASRVECLRIERRTFSNSKLVRGYKTWTEVLSSFCFWKAKMGWLVLC